MNPLLVDEVIHYLIHRWGKKYDFRLFRRGKFVYFQMMWGFLGQESFPLSEDEYKKSIADKIEILNSCLLYTSPSPRDLSTSRMPSSA